VARLSRHEDSVEGTVENIGAGGVFFSTEDLEFPVEEGSEVVLTLRIRRDGDETVWQRTGCVLRTERYFDGTAVVRAFAVKFDEVVALDDSEFAEATR
jgi:PilZ domain-containing protein